MRSLEVRPEQARELLALHAEKVRAEGCWQAGVRVVLAGLVPDGSTVTTISDDGTITVSVPEENQGG